MWNLVLRRQICYQLHYPGTHTKNEYILYNTSCKHMKVIFLSQKSHCVKYTRTRDFADPFQYKARICRFYAYAYTPPPFSVLSFSECLVFGVRMIQTWIKFKNWIKGGRQISDGGLHKTVGLGTLCHLSVQTRFLAYFVKHHDKK